MEMYFKSILTIDDIQLFFHHKCKKEKFNKDSNCVIKLTKSKLNHSTSVLDILIWAMTKKEDERCGTGKLSTSM